jgi:hypothetical protein
MLVVVSTPGKVFERYSTIVDSKVSPPGLRKPPKVFRKPKSFRGLREVFRGQSAASIFDCKTLVRIGRV